MGAANEAAYVTAPIAGEVVCLSVNDTAARFIIPASFAGAPCTFSMEGCDADILFGGSSVACAYGATNTVNAEAIALGTTQGIHLNDGQPVYMVMPASNRAGYFSVDCVGSGSGKLTIAVTGAR